MSSSLNVIHISEVSKMLAESPSVTTHAIQLGDPFDATHPLIIQLQLSSVTIYFDVYSSSIAEYVNEDIPNIHLTDEEPPWDPSTEEYSERETCMLDHWVKIIIPATVSSGSLYVSTVILYSLAYDAADVMDDDNLGIVLLAQIQVSLALIGTVKNCQYSQ